ncbi:MAG: F0F1 ATP synthase subunit A [Kiritimatiellae bacterium]|nr:F0F1 ATP synthase subunit A [Kiritimatiellia bacterium]
MPDALDKVLDVLALIPRSTWTTWGVMWVLVLVSLALVRRLSLLEPGRLQSVFELLVEQMCSLTREIVRSDPAPYVPLVGTLFLFVFVANLAGMVPSLSSPTADLSVTAGLAAVVFFSVPFFGVRARGVRKYLKMYLDPNPFMLPFNILGELTRTLSLAIRLFGNIMSGEFLLMVVIGVVTSVLHGYARVFIPVSLVLSLFLSVLSLITAAIQAYIFTVLALVYIGAAVERRVAGKEEKQASQAGAEGGT